jgi:energy-coupling factor transporter ATP-binding protein EcfA2
VLVLVGGPTGVGKTTLITALAGEGCRVVHTYTTRPPRPGERFKTSMPPKAYRDAAGLMLWPAQHLYGAFYGEDYAQVMAAACPRNPTPWLVDAAPETLAIFEHVPHFTLILLPADADFLPHTLALANRLERLKKARQETGDWQRVAVAGSGTPSDVAGRVPVAAVACKWGQQAEIVELSRRHIVAWQGLAGRVASH